MSYRPFSDDTLFTSGGDCYPNTTNFSAAEILFLCDEPTSTTSGLVTSTIGDLVVTNATATQLTRAADGTIQIKNSGGTAQSINSITSGTFPSVTGKKLFMFMLAKPASGAAFILGKASGTLLATDKAIRMVAGGAVSQVANGTAVQSTGPTLEAGDGSTYWAYGLTVEPTSATGFTGYSFDGTTLTTAATVADLSSLADFDFDSELIQISSTMNPGMFGLMAFTTLPSAAEIKGFLAWSHSKFVNDIKKYIYPPFRRYS